VATVKLPRCCVPPLLAAASLVLGGADWPGRERELAAAAVDAPPARRIELLTEIAAAPGPESEAAVVRALADPERSVRLAAADLVARYRLAGAREVLVGWLGESSPEQRAAATRALGAIGEPRVLPALVRLLGDADVAVRLASVESAAAVGGADATVPLLNRLADGESVVRVATARALSTLGDPRAVLSLLGALQDPMPEVREAAATALGRLRDPRAVRGLLGLLRDAQAEVRLAAARALGTLGAPEAVIDLAPLALREERGGDPQSRNELARVAIEAIGRVGGPSAREVLVRVFRRSETDAELARVAGQALLTLGTEAESAIPALVVTPMPATLRAPVIELLGEIGGEPAADALLTMYDAPEGARSAENFQSLPGLLRALGRTGVPRVVPTLLRAAAIESLPAGDTPRQQLLLRAAEERRRGALAGLQAYVQRRGQLEPAALDPLAQLLQGIARTATNTSARALTADLAELIGHTRNPRAPRVLAPLLASEQREVRAAAAGALARVGVQGVETEVARALGDAWPDVRLSAADALGQHGDRAALEALLAVWQSDRPIDRANAARALGRIAARVRDPRGAALLGGALPAASPALAAALLDGLSFAAFAGDAAARTLLASALERPALAPAAAEALANALGGAEAETRTALAPVLLALARQPGAPAPRAAALWGLGRVGSEAQPVLVEALRDPHYAVLANAAGALARLYASGTAPAEDARPALCRVLETRRHPSVRTNVLMALARGGMVCDADRQRRILLDGRSDAVRMAAAESLASLARTAEPARARTMRGALEQCAVSDRAVSVAQRCRVLTDASASSSGNAVRPDVIDALVVGDDEETVALGAPVALVMADGVMRVSWTGPGGWIHERPAPEGPFSVLDPDSQPPEP
jgi:HEAT repeat protein